MKTILRKYPAFITALPLAIGIFISYFSAISLTYLPVYAFILLLAFFGSVIIVLYRKIFRSKFFPYSYWTMLIFFGFVSFQLQYFKIDDDNLSRIIPASGELKTTVKGVISEKPEIKEDRLRIVLCDISINSKKLSGEVIATVYRNSSKRAYDRNLEYGDIVEITGKLEKLPHRRNPGEFDYGEYLKLHGIDAIFTAIGYDKISLTGHEEQSFYMGSIIYPVREYSIKVMDEMIGGDEGEFLKGLVLGEKSNISREIKENFINAGVAHIIAVSGLNVAYVIIILWGVLTFIPIKQIFKILITIVLLVFYMNLTGNSPSIVRATIMASIFLIARIIERKPNGYNTVSFAALVILLIDPRQLFDAGFILSFSAILSIMFIYPVLNRWVNSLSIYERLKDQGTPGRAIVAVTTMFLGTLAAQLGTLPVTAMMFRKISIVSLAANLFAIPLSNIALGLGFIMIICSAVSAWLASVFAALNSVLLYLQLVMIEYSAKLDFSFVETYFVDWFLFASYFVVLVLVVTAVKHNLKFRIIVILLVIANFYVWKGVLDKTAFAEITYLDAGNSNCTLIKMPQGTNMLINTGTSTEKYTSAGRNVIPYLKTKGISCIDLVIITSLNKSEFRNLKYLAENFSIKRICLPAYYKPLFEIKELYGSFRDIDIDLVRSSKTINKQGNFRVYLYYDSLFSGSSMMAQFVYGSKNFIFNDSKEFYDDAVNTLLLPQGMKCDVLKAGSFDNTSADFIIRSSPEYAVVYSGSGRKRPSAEIFTESLEHIGIKVFSPDKNGAVIFRTDGKETMLYNW